MNNHPTPKQLDAQSPVRIHRWLDIDSEECRAQDETNQNARKWLRQQMESGFMFLDSDGRVWCKHRDKPEYYPYHFESGSSLIGYRISKKAAN